MNAQIWLNAAVLGAEAQTAKPNRRALLEDTFMFD